MDTTHYNMVAYLCVVFKRHNCCFHRRYWFIPYVEVLVLIVNFHRGTILCIFKLVLSNLVIFFDVLNFLIRLILEVPLLDACHFNRASCPLLLKLCFVSEQTLCLTIIVRALLHLLLLALFLEVVLYNVCLCHVQSFNLVSELRSRANTVDVNVVFLDVVHQEISWVKAHDSFLVTDYIYSENDGVQALVDEFDYIREVSVFHLNG